jgi:protein O-mannosyl-transferase
LAHHTIQPVPLSRPQRWAALAALAALAIAASWPSLFNDFTYDDRFIVLKNPVLQDLRHWWRFFETTYWPPHWGGEGYRPLTIFCLGVEWAVGGGRPAAFHAMNIALYAIVTIAVFHLGETCLPFAAAWVVAAIFAVHPLHVEAVANVVGQSELLVALLLTVAVTLYVRRRNANELSLRSMAGIALLYACACLSKEHGIVLPALLLAAELTIVTDGAPLRVRLTPLRPFLLMLALVAVAYLAAHVAVSTQTITGFRPYPPFSILQVGTAGRIFTMFGVVPEWLRLLLWPVRLSPEYGPPANPVVADFQLYQLPGIIIALATFALAVASWRRLPAVSFGIWFMAMTLLPASNLLFPAAGFLSERVLFAPSIGVLIALGGLVPWAYRRLTRPAGRMIMAGVLAVLIVVAAWRSSDRSRIWKNNTTLFERAVVEAPNVYRSHFMLGSIRFNEGRMLDGEREFNAAIALYDRDPIVFYFLGEEYRDAGIFGSAARMYRRALGIDSTLIEARARLALSYAELGRWPDADREARRTLAENTHEAKAMLDIVRLAGTAKRFPVRLPPHPISSSALVPVRRSR